MKNKKLLVIGVVVICLLVAAIFFAVSHYNTGNLGSVENDPAQKLSSLTIVKDSLPGADEVIAEVNGWQILLSELIFNYETNRLAGQNLDIQEVFDILVEEKAAIAHAQEENLLPTDADIQERTDKIKTKIAASEDYKKQSAALLDTLKMTEDEYWNVYEKYVIYKDLAMDNLSDKVKDDGMADKSVTVISDYYYAQYLAYKQKVDFKMVTANPDYQFTPNLDKLFLVGKLSEKIQ